MARFRLGILFGLLILVVAPAAASDTDEEGGWSYDGNLRYRSPDARFELDLVNRLQARLTVENPEAGEAGQSFDVNRFRVLLAGRALDDWKFLVQTDLATGSLSSNQSESELLLDASVTWARHRLAQIRVGQGKVGFGRQFLIDSGYLQFVDRSIATERFVPGRDVGIALLGENEDRTYGYSVGLYNGNGINEETDENENYMATARLEVAPLGPLELVESDPDGPDHTGPRLAVAVAGMTNLVGEGSFEEERIKRGALELALRWRGFSFVSEFFTESRDTLTGAPLDETDADGWYAQAGYAFPFSRRGVLELAGRYSEILADVVDADRTETGGAVSLYLRGHRAKIQVDFRALDFEEDPFGDTIDTEEARAQLQLIF
jgi:hypothetical protein